MQKRDTKTEMKKKLKEGKGILKRDTGEKINDRLQKGLQKKFNSFVQTVLLLNATKETSDLKST